MDIQQATVLLIDDDAEVRDAVGRLLRSAGWQAETFASADEFVERARLDGIGCIVLDICMDGMNGMELHEWIRAHRITQPVIFLSAHCDVPISVQAMKHGAIDVLQKPADADTLLEAISSAVRRHGDDVRRRNAIGAIENRVRTLSVRERQVMGHVISGRLNKQIAAALCITEKTVKVHRARAMSKMRARSVAELVHMCDEIGLAGERS
jgi:FixJ family two-component response regulator